MLLGEELSPRREEAEIEEPSEEDTPQQQKDPRLRHLEEQPHEKEIP